MRKRPYDDIGYITDEDTGQITAVDNSEIS